MKFILKIVLLLILFSSFSYSQDRVPKNQYLYTLSINPSLYNVDSLIALKELSLIVPYVFDWDHQYAPLYEKIAGNHSEWYKGYNFQVITVVFEVTNLTNSISKRKIEDLMKGGNDWIANFQYLFDSYYRDSRQEISVFNRSQSFGEFLGFFDTSFPMNSILVDRSGNEIYRFDGANPVEEINKVLRKYKSEK